jgi:TIR domain
MQFQYDIFVSYAAVTNNLPNPYGKWVTRLVDDLGKMISNKMGGHPVRIYFDERTLEPNHQLEKILDDVRASRLFLAISSPAYNSRPWPRKELETFIEAHKSPDRLFAIAVEPVPDSDLLKPLRGRHRSSFHEPTDENNPRLPAPFEPGTTAFFRKLWDLADVIAAQIISTRMSETSLGSGFEVLEKPKTGIEQSGLPSRTVLLCQETEDLEGEMSTLRRALTQVPTIKLLSAIAVPQNSEEFQTAFRSNVDKADLVVQLLGPLRGRISDGMPEGYVRFQANVAHESKSKLMQWRRSDVLLENVGEASHRALLQSETVIASTLTSFVKEVIDQLTAPPPSQKQAVEGPSRSIVFVNADKSDLDAALKCGTALSSGFDVILPPMEDEERSVSVQEELNNCLAAADAVLLMQGLSGPNWVRSQLTQALKIRSVSKREIVGAVLHGPPKGKRSINMLIKGIKELDCTSADGTEWSFEGIENVLINAPKA